MIDHIVQGNAFQDLDLEEYSHCFGCGRNNKYGHNLKSFWSDDMNFTVAKITPSNIYTGGVPDHLYGGLIASAQSDLDVIRKEISKSSSFKLIQ